MGYSTGHQENSQEFSGVISIHGNGSYVIFPAKTCALKCLQRKDQSDGFTRTSAYPLLIISIYDVFCLGPSGVGVNELRRQLIELNLTFSKCCATLCLLFFHRGSYWSRFSFTGAKRSALY